MWNQDYVTNFISIAHISNLAHTQIKPEFNCLLATIDKQNDPISFKEAVKSEHWIMAMNNELEALELNDTQDVVPLPLGKIVIWSKWLFKTKYLFDGTIERYKYRLVAQGFKQKLGLIILKLML